MTMKTLEELQESQKLVINIKYKIFCSDFCLKIENFWFRHGKHKGSTNKVELRRKYCIKMNDKIFIYWKFKVINQKCATWNI